MEEGLMPANGWQGVALLNLLPASALLMIAASACAAWLLL